MAVIELEDIKTGETIFVEDSLLPGGKDMAHGSQHELSVDDIRKAEVEPIDGGLQVGIYANAPEKKDTTPVEYIGNSIKGRGDNWAGGLRNFLSQGLGMGVGDEAEALFRRYIYDPAGKDLSYDEYLQNARDSYKGYSAMHPSRAVAMQVGGALLPTLLTMGAAAPATAALSTGAMMGRGALTGLGMGALQGYLTGEGDNRLTNAAQNAVIGGATGGLVPGVIKGGQNALKWASQIRKGSKENVARSDAGRRMVDLISGANDDYIDNTMYLGAAAMKGEGGIQKAAKDINLLRKEAMKAQQKGYNPNIVDGYSDLTQSLKTPEMLAADKAYVDFAASVPEGTNSGMAINSFFKKHPVAKDIYMKYGEKMPDVKPNSFQGMRDINEALRNKLKRAVASKDEALVDDIRAAQKDLSVIRENTTPGVKAIDKQWSTARNKQDVVDDVFFDNVKKVANPKEMLSPELSATGVARSLWPARVRGMGRELLETGKVAPSGQGKWNQAIEQLFDPLKNVGAGRLRIGPVPTTRAGQAIMTDYELGLQNIE
jgi:hypothetical protein